MVTRLVVDDDEVDYFRVITGNTVYHTNTISGYVALSEGKHDVRVEYRTPGTFSSRSTDDWTTAELQVVYWVTDYYIPLFLIRPIYPFVF